MSRRWHNFFTGLLATLACLLVVVTVLATWTYATVLNTDRFVGTVSAVTADPAVIASASDKFATQVVVALQIQSRLEALLPDRLDPLAAQFTDAVRDRIATAIKSGLSSDRFQALLERGTNKLYALEYLSAPEEIYQAREGDDGLLKGSKLDLKVERNQVTGALVYDGKSFDSSAERAGFDTGLGHVVALSLQGHLSMDELERGDRLRVIGQEVTVLGEFARYTGIEAVEVVSANPKREPLRVYYFDDPNLRGYYDASGKSPYEGGWRKPIPGAAITSAFNPRRMHPILHKIMPHMGTDIGAAMGTPVGAAAPGTVSYIGPGGAAGNLLKVMHGNGIETGYAHLSRYVAGIKVGDKVKRLQTIGYVGSTGRSTGPHLHFSAQRDGKFFDAETLNLDGMRVLNKDQREQFLLVVAKYNPLLDAIALPAPLPGAAAKTSEAAPAGSAIAPAASAEDPGLAAGAGEDNEASKAPAAQPAPHVVGNSPSNSVYLSDKELLKMQSATDEGEVSE